MQRDSKAPLGWFYIAAVEPEREPERLKLGWSRNVAERIRQHKTRWPRVRLLWKWPCLSSLERHAIDYLSQLAEERPEREVLIIEDRAALRASAKAYLTGAMQVLDAEGIRPLPAHMKPLRPRHTGTVREVRPNVWRGEVMIKTRRYSVSGRSQEEVLALLASWGRHATLLKS